MGLFYGCILATIIISYHADVTKHDSLVHLSRFIHSAIKQQHHILGVFLYQHAVYHASQSISLPTDELQITRTWQSIADLGIPLTLCVTAAEKRGVNTEQTQPFQVAGLAEFAMNVISADKWVQFK